MGHIASESDRRQNLSTTDESKAEDESNDGIQRLLPLFQLLVREPPKGHDFASCPICKTHGIDSLEA